MVAGKGLHAGMAEIEKKACYSALEKQAFHFQFLPTTGEHRLKANNIYVSLCTSNPDFLDRLQILYLQACSGRSFGKSAPFLMSCHNKYILHRIILVM